jgi:hypothetical protein
VSAPARTDATNGVYRRRPIILHSGRTPSDAHLVDSAAPLRSTDVSPRARRRRRRRWRALRTDGATSGDAKTVCRRRRKGDGRDPHPLFRHLQTATSSETGLLTRKSSDTRQLYLLEEIFKIRGLTQVARRNVSIRILPILKMNIIIIMYYLLLFVVGVTLSLSYYVIICKITHLSLLNINNLFIMICIFWEISSCGFCVYCGSYFLHDY